MSNHYKTGTWVYFEGFDSLRKESKGLHWGMVATTQDEPYPCYTVLELADNRFGNEYYYEVRDEDIKEAFNTDIPHALKFAVAEDRPNVNLLMTRELRLNSFKPNATLSNLEGRDGG